MAREKVPEKGKHGNKKVWIVLLIAAVLATLVLLLISCGKSGSRAKPEDDPALESAEPEVTEIPEVIVEPTASSAPEESVTEIVTPSPEVSATPVETGSTGGGDESGQNNNNNNEEKPPEKHEHHWQPVYVTIHHEEKSHVETVIVTPAWDEDVYGATEAVCSSCGYHTSDTGAIWDHIWEAHDGNAGYSVQPVLTDTIHHDAVTEQRIVIDSPAYDEEVIDHYTCTCGQRKPA